MTDPGKQQMPTTIVVVEDEPDTAEMLAEMMRLSGYRVYNSHGGISALSLIIETRPDAVVLDLMMPDLSGLDVLQQLRRDPRLGKIPVVVVSARGLPADVRTSQEAGAFAHLAKPVSFADLRLTIDRAIRETQTGKS